MELEEDDILYNCNKQAEVDNAGEFANTGVLPHPLVKAAKIKCNSFKES